MIIVIIIISDSNRSIGAYVVNDLPVRVQACAYVFRVRDSLGIGQGEVHAYKVHAKGQLIFAPPARILVPIYSAKAFMTVFKLLNRASVGL